MSVKITGDDKLQRTLISLGKDMEDAMVAGVFLTANRVRTHAIKSIQGNSMGTWVKRSSQGGGTYDHVASAPGLAPNTDTGGLVKSIAVEMDKEKIEAEVGSNLDYASWLEFGTKRNLSPRPWLEPALDAHKDDLRSNIAKAAMKIIEGRAK